MPQEIGAAAAYEAYRQIKYGTNAYEFLYGDYELQRDALRGLAIAEGTLQPSIGCVSSHAHVFSPHSIPKSRSLMAGHGARGHRPIWLANGVRHRGGDGQQHSRRA